MSGFWLIIALLLVASCVLVVLAGSRGNSASANDRDTLNQRFYHQRLRELEDDEAQGVVDDRPEMVRELQLALLMDIPERSPVIQRQVSRRVLLPGVVVLLLVSCGVYLKAGAATAAGLAASAKRAARTARTGDEPQCSPANDGAAGKAGAGPTH